jgi:hypothetical protein
MGCDNNRTTTIKPIYKLYFKQLLLHLSKNFSCPDFCPTFLWVKTSSDLNTNSIRKILFIFLLIFSLFFCIMVFYRNICIIMVNVLPGIFSASYRQNTDWCYLYKDIWSYMLPLPIILFLHNNTRNHVSCSKWRYCKNIYDFLKIMLLIVKLISITGHVTCIIIDKLWRYIVPDTWPWLCRNNNLIYLVVYIIGIVWQSM